MERARYAITILKDPQVVYSFWRELSNLPLFSRHLNHVEVVDARRSVWTAEGPNGPVKWEAEITEDIPNQRIAWRALPGSEVMNEGTVDFFPAPGDRGTEVIASLQFDVAGGPIANWIAAMTGNSPQQEISETLRRFKALLECGELPVVEGQPSELMRGSSHVGDESKKVGTR